MTVEIVTLTVSILALVGVGAIAVGVLRAHRADDEPNDGVRAIEQMGTQLSQLMGAVGVYQSEVNGKLAKIEGTVADHRSTLTEQVRNMGAQIGTITGLFTNDRARGNWGEISMLRAFETGGLTEGLDYTYHPTAGAGVPDAIVHVPGGCDIVIDAKFPTVRYLEALEVDDREERKRLLVEQGKELRKVGKSLIGRGYADHATGGYVVVYLPSQAVYEAALSASPDVVDELLGMRVMVAGPTALFALLMNVASVMKEHRAIEQADAILDAAKDLQGRVGTFLGHLGSTGQHLRRTVESFNGAVGSWTSRVEPQLVRIGDLNGESIEADVVPIDEAVREWDVVWPPLKVAER